MRKMLFSGAGSAYFELSWEHGAAPLREETKKLRADAAAYDRALNGTDGEFMRSRVPSLPVAGPLAHGACGTDGMLDGVNGVLVSSADGTYRCGEMTFTSDDIGQGDDSVPALSMSMVLSPENGRLAVSVSSASVEGAAVQNLRAMPVEFFMECLDAYADALEADEKAGEAPAVRVMEDGSWGKA